jgi:predicted enzyme related to lactoylglutathione lyase
MAKLKAVAPISGEDINALPVKELASAITFFEKVLGFSASQRTDTTIILIRDHVRIGLTQNPNHQPGKAGSLAFAVDDLQAMHDELNAKAANPGKLGIDRWDGRQYRTFFLRENDNGSCFCFHSPL